MNKYSAKRNGKKFDSMHDAGREYLGRELKKGDVINIWVHCEVMGKSFLKTFDIGVLRGI